MFSDPSSPLIPVLRLSGRSAWLQIFEPIPGGSPGRTGLWTWDLSAFETLHL